MKKRLISAAILAASLVTSANAADYVVDDKGAHAAINFKVKHLGYSWLTGRFNVFDGKFSYDEKNIESSKISINIDPNSIDSNHAERDKHLRSGDFLDVSKFKTAKFESTKIVDKGNGKLAITGDFTMHGVTKSIVIDAEKIGAGDDPWGGYRAGFSGTTKIAMKDFGFKMDFGDVLLDLHVEGIRQ
ncbi:YceI family protein [Thalassomonas actiniarum]|uniref:YceI family protein n=1 Tax=Thalassomonas actiniarum TaxID=485447 RepID=A0AAF0C2L5_9GAMM|nr:YceI family protein [Thalassomonas actiniarum]WDE00282.1 YceI family protein [Thalassomonas actiniarum]